MWSAFCRTPRSGRLKLNHCRRRNIRAAGGHQSVFAEIASINQSQLSSLLTSCPTRLGAKSNGEKAQTSRFLHGSLECVFASHIVTTISPKLDLKSGC